MKPRFGEMQARSMRDATEMQPRWMRDESEIWRDAGLCKFSQFSKTSANCGESYCVVDFLCFSAPHALRLFNCQHFLWLASALPCGSCFFWVSLPLFVPFLCFCGIPFCFFSVFVGLWVTPFSRPLFALCAFFWLNIPSHFLLWNRVCAWLVNCQHFLWLASALVHRAGESEAWAAQPTRRPAPAGALQFAFRA